MMMGGDELTESYIYDTAAYDDDFTCESDMDDCCDLENGGDVIGPFGALHGVADCLAVNTSRQR
jgi:hypothetical protein